MALGEFDIPDDLPADLEEIHRQGLEVGERGHAAPEILQRRSATAGPDSGKEPRRPGDRGQRGGLGDLEAERRRGNPYLDNCCSTGSSRLSWVSAAALRLIEQTGSSVSGDSLCHRPSRAIVSRMTQRSIAGMRL